jgi:hypothetical protein
MKHYPVTDSNAMEHAATLRINYDQSSPFYKMVNCREFWGRPVEEKILVLPHLPQEISDHITNLYQQDQL